MNNLGSYFRNDFMTELIELDGSHEEGGGQILRTALGLSVLTLKPFRLTNIRKNRDVPGLKAQHVSCIKACAEFSNASVAGNNIGSMEIEFIPKVIKNRQMSVSIGTAGSISLLLQSVLLPILFTESEIKISGGTDVKWSIPIDYFLNIIRPLLLEYGNIEINYEKRGYYPIGGGIVVVKNKPRFKRIDFDSFEKFHQYIFGNPPIELSRNGELMFINGISHASSDLQDKKVAERQAQNAELILKQKCKANVQSEYSKTDSTGSGILVYAVYKYLDGKKMKQYRIAADVLGEKGVKAEEIGRIASEKLLGIIKNEIIVDECMQDNIIPMLGLFGGRIKTGKITGHTKSNIAVCEKFLNVKYHIESQREANFISVLSSSNP